jgi:hypothetical protein
MSKRSVLLIAGLLIGAVLNVLFNLIAAGIQQRAFRDQFSNQSIWLMIGFAVAGLLVGYWVSLNVETTSHSSDSRAGIEAKDLTSREGGVIADERTGRGIAIEKVDANKDIHLSSSDSQSSPPPKAPPPA